MTTVLLAGLSDHDAAAVEILISMTWRDKRCVLLKRTPRFSLPEQSLQAAACGQVVLDLGGVGLHQYSAENAQVLQQFLAQRPAILLTRSEGGWAQSPLAQATDGRVVFLSVPYSRAALGQALGQLDRAALAPSAPPKPAVVQPADHGRDRDRAWAVTRPGALLGAKPHKPEQAQAVAVMAALPALGRRRFLRLVSKISGSDAQVLHIGSAQLLLHPQEAWVAASMPVSALLKVLGNAEQLDGASMERLSSPAAAAAQRQLTQGRGQRYMVALDVVLWELCAHALGDVDLALGEEVALRLQRFPNFTQLSQTGVVDVQLAALCVRGPQSVHKLLAHFAGQEQAVLRFVALVCLSGLGQLQALETKAAKPNSRWGALGPNAPAREPTRGHKERRGFLRALLDKLF